MLDNLLSIGPLEAGIDLETLLFTAYLDLYD